MKLGREKESRLRKIHAREALNTSETEESPMLDFEQLFTSEERKKLEEWFGDAVKELEAGKLDKREFIEGELGGLLILDQVLTIPLVAENLRQRAKDICQTANPEYVDQVLAAIAVKPLNANLTERLGATRRVFAEHGGRTQLPTKVVKEILQRLMGPERPSEWDEAKILFNLLILSTEQQSTIKKFAWSHGLDDIWQTDRVAQDRLLPKALHRLLEPATPLSPVGRRKWLDNYKLDPDLSKILGLNIRGYSWLAILLAPEPRVMPDGRIDLGMPRKKMAGPRPLPDRPV